MSHMNGAEGYKHEHEISSDDSDLDIVRQSTRTLSDTDKYIQSKWDLLLLYSVGYATNFS